MDSIKIYVDLPNAFIIIMNENQLTLDAVIQSAGIDAEISYTAIPYTLDDGTHSKSLVPLIIASSGLILSIGIAVSTILKTIYRRPILTKIIEAEELRDASGNLEKNTNGNPQYKLVTRYEMLEPRKEDRQVKLELKAGAVILRFSSEDSQSD